MPVTGTVSYISKRPSFENSSIVYEMSKELVFPFLWGSPQQQALSPTYADKNRTRWPLVRSDGKGHFSHHHLCSQDRHPPTLTSLDTFQANAEWLIICPDDFSMPSLGFCLQSLFIENFNIKHTLSLKLDFNWSHMKEWFSTHNTWGTSVLLIWIQAVPLLLL